MGQKTNPIIYKISQTNFWQYNYIEKKFTELQIYPKKVFEIKNFIYKFFKNQKLIPYNLILNCSDNYLYVTIYYCTTVTNTNFKTIENKKLTFKSGYNKSIFLKTSDKNLLKKQLSKGLSSITFNKLKIFLVLKDINQQKQSKNVVKLYLKRMKQYRSFKTLENVSKFKKSLENSLFYIKNVKRKKSLKLKIYKVINNNVIKLRRFQSNELFDLKKTINILLNIITTKRCSSLLASFIALNLQTIKKHGVFLRFLKDAIQNFSSFSHFLTFKGVKIKIKGRINARPRSKSQTIKLLNGLKILSTNSNIGYSEKTSFTAKGTISVKVWIHDKI